ncbi:MAG: c-type cytochrome domain-containing protein [Planctomycetota bacterium]|nr:c-type cytochrome domain-containing protein [Planctomycetota bacterium]
MISMLLSLVVLSVGFFADEAPPYDPTDPSQVAESEAGHSDDDAGLAGPSVDPESLDPRDGRRGEMMTEAMQSLSLEGLLEARCGQCHGPRKQKAGLQVVPVEAMFTGPREDWVVIPGRPAQSILVERISLPAGHDDVMPPDGAPLTTEQISRIKTWINKGATVEAAREGDAMTLGQGARPQRNRQIRPRVWMETYFELDLTPEQRATAMAAAQKLQRETRAFQQTWGSQMQEMQKQIRALGREPSEEATKLKAELKVIQAKQPDVASVQESLWNALDSEQQSVMRSALEELKRNRRGLRNQRSMDDAKQRSDVQRPLDEETRRRIRLLLEERRKAREMAPGTDSGSN